MMTIIIIIIIIIIITTIIIIIIIIMISAGYKYDEGKNAPNVVCCLTGAN